MIEALKNRFPSWVFSPSPSFYLSLESTPKTCHTRNKNKLKSINIGKNLNLKICTPHQSLLLHPLRQSLISPFSLRFQIDCLCWKNWLPPYFYLRFHSTVCLFYLCDSLFYNKHLFLFILIFLSFKTWGNFEVRKEGKNIDKVRFFTLKG